MAFVIFLSLPVLVPSLVPKVPVYVSITEVSTTFTITHPELKLFSYDYDGWISLLAAGVIGSSIVFLWSFLCRASIGPGSKGLGMAKENKTFEKEAELKSEESETNEARSYQQDHEKHYLSTRIWRFLGSRVDVAILNTGFLLADALAFWAFVRNAGLTMIHLLDFQMAAPKILVDLSDVIGFALIIFLSYTLIEISKQAFPPGEIHKPNAESAKDGVSIIQRMLQTGIIALVIAILQILPSFSNASLYKGWASYSPFVPIGLTLAFSVSVTLLAFGYYWIDGKEKKTG
ncbi:MAG: hypothetical protein ACYC7D_03495 [Nitrososphaerales archaeon]